VHVVQQRRGRERFIAAWPRPTRGDGAATNRVHMPEHRLDVDLAQEEQELGFAMTDASVCARAVSAGGQSTLVD
jgi:hypothetical protein